MKRNLQLLILAALIFFGISEVIAQENPYAAKPGFDIGFGFGGSYQQSDLRNSSGAGVTFMFGHSIYQKPGAFFGLDWRLRFLGGQNDAFDDRINSINTYSNIEYTHFNYDLEFVLTLNRFRERTRIIISGFGGAGATHNTTNFDLTKDGVAYDYSVINSDGDDSRYAIRNDLESLSDNIFETDGISRFCFSPTLGLFLGYQVTPRFSIGIEHKINYFLEEGNTNIGANIDGIESISGPIDKNHYTGLSFKWDLGHGSASVPCNQPVVSLNVRESNSSFASHQLDGTVTNVKDTRNITVTINGIPDNNFYFDPSSGRISSSFNLLPGNHKIVLSAQNGCGQDSEFVEVFVKEPCYQPDVEVTLRESNIREFTHQLNANINNVSERLNVNVSVDGVQDNTFEFVDGTNQIRDNYKLAPGKHTITVSVTNECGQDSQSVVVEIEAPCDLPVVDFTVVESSQNNYTHQLRGTILNVNSKNDITVIVGGRTFGAFNYSPTNHQISASFKLSPKNQTITIIAKNECGEVSESTEIIFDNPCDLPVISFSVNDSNHDDFTNQLIGEVSNITNQNQISIYIDGKLNPKFSFSPSTNQLSANYNLLPGTHIITIKAKNECGEDANSAEIIIDEPCKTPVVTFGVVEFDHDAYTHSLSGFITNVEDKNNINIFINGKPHKDFGFIPKSNKITAKLQLEPGKHIITITAKNDCDSDTESVDVIVEAPCKLPVVRFKVTESNNTNFSHLLDGIITNIDNQNQISIFIDGKEHNNFDFTPSTGKINSLFKLEPGKHTITVHAKNDCGSDSQFVEIIIEKPCIPPVVSFSFDEIIHSSFTHQLIGTVTNVIDKNHITVSIDGRVNNSFQYVPNTNKLSGKFSLRPGKHIITVKAKNDCGEDSQTVEIIIEEPCVDPKVNFSIEEITHASFTHEMNGTVTNVKNKSEITVLVDGNEDNSFQYIPNTSSLSGKFKLEPGTHTITVIAKNDCGEDSQTIEIVIEEPCVDPKVNFSIEEITHASFTHEMNGTVTNVKNKSEITVLVDGDEDNSFQYIPNTNSLSGKFKLEPGTHTITVIAKNDCGEDSQTVEIIIEEPCVDPKVNFSIEEITHASFTHEMNGTVTNVKNKSEITVLVDGNEDNSFQYIPSTNKLSGKFKLEPGTHTITVIAKNDCGEDSQTIEITVEEPCIDPSVKFSIEEMDHATFTHQMNGVVTNVQNKSEITVLVDGNEDNSFQYIPSTNKLSGKFKLEPGKHEIRVIAKNDCGEDSQTIEINVEEPCVQPTIKFTVKEISHASFTHELSGSITNMENKNGISIKVDGKSDNSFQFIPKDNKISSKYKLSPGRHTITIAAKNDCGNDTESIQVIVEEPCVPPTVNFTIDEMEHTTFTHNLKGNLTNIKNKNQITVLINDEENNSFQYIPSSGIISNKIKLDPGNYTIKVIAKNDCGEDSQSMEITVEEPCDEPEVSFSVYQSGSDESVYELSGTAMYTNNRSEIAVIVDGQSDDSFQFISSTNTISATLVLEPGNHTIKVMASNKCGEDSQTIQVTVKEPCVAPTVNVYLNESNLSGTVTNIQSKNDITVTVDGSTTSSFQFIPSTGQISASFNFDPGTHNITVSAGNKCGNDSDYAEITIEEPCSPPTVNFSVSETSLNNYTHQLTGTTTNIDNKSDISITVNGSSDHNFQFITSSGSITSMYNFEPGTYTIVITVKNDCGEDSHSVKVTIEEEVCGPRFNPGNADWQFCLITPSGTYNRSDLDDNFSYSGSASSLFFKATAGGGDAIVNGQPYSITSGKYYHFEGSLSVTVSTSNPGSMGLWSVCIESNKAPKSGVGNSAPVSPCEEIDDGKNGGDDGRGGTNDVKENDSNNQNINVGGRNGTNGRTNTSGRTGTNTTNEETNVSGGRTGRAGTSTSGRTGTKTD